MSLSINFENPSAISTDITELDILEIKFKKQELVISAETKEYLLEQDSSFSLSLSP